MKKNPKKILFLQATSEIGGTDITLLRTLEALDCSRFEAHVVFPKPGPLLEAFKSAGCEIHFIPLMRQLSSRRGILYLIQYILGFWPAVFQMAALICREKIDLVHTNTIHNLYGFLAALITGRPHVWHIREIVVQSRLVRAVEVFLVRHFSTRFIVMSNAIAESFLGKRNGFPRNLVKLYDGLDLQTFSPERSGRRIRKDLGLDDKTPLVGMVCRLDPWKGLDLFLDAAARIHRQRPDVKFLICGGEIEGHQGYEAKLRQKVEAEGFAESVFFTGWKYSGLVIPEVYRALNISVQCSIYPEPYGLASIEAMASAIPVVATREGGPAELCVDQKTAVLVPPRDAEKIAQAVLMLLENLERARVFGLAGRRRAEMLFDRTACVEKLETIYDQIFSEQKRGPR